MKNTPAFQYYPKDLLSDPDIVVWDMTALGAYWKLVSHLWVAGGSCEYDVKTMARLFNVHKHFIAERLWNQIKIKFTLKDGVITHEGLLKQMQVQVESRLRRQQAGIKGAQSRWGDDSNAIDLPMAKNGSSSSTSTSTPTATSTSSSIATSVRESKKPLALDDHDLLEVVLRWAETNGIDEQNIRDDQVTAWKGALSCHGKSVCLEYIGKVKATSPGWIISRMNKDAANAAETVDRSAVAANSSGQAAGRKVYDGSDVDWEAVAREYADQDAG